MRCVARSSAPLLLLLLLHSAAALPSGGRAVGASPASSAPYMTLKPFVAAGHKRAVASPWAPAAAPAAPAAAPGAPVADPAGFYAAKKADFMSKLFSGLGPAGPAGASPMDFWLPPTPAPAPAPADDPLSQAQLLAQLVNSIVDAPEPTLDPMLLLPPVVTPKPTIVPPGFWVPDSPIMPPGAYKAKVATFLGKLFSSLNLTAGAAGGAGGAKMARHSRPGGKAQTWERALVQSPVDISQFMPPAAQQAAPAAPAAAPQPAQPDPKDIVISSILNEVSQLKTAFVDTLTDVLAKSKELAAVAPTKRPKLLPPWVPTPPPTADPMEPFQKRIDTLGQVFDMLTALGKTVASPANASAPARRALRSVPGRSVQMAVHQGYQSMPPGTEELISAGAGRDPNSAKEGGGLNLKIKVPQ